MQAKAPVRRRNAVLDHVSNKDFALLEPILEPVELGFRKHLQSANRRLDTVYFPQSGLASVVAVGGGERKQAEVAIIGPEGFVGVPIVLGVDRSPHEVFMQAEGEGHSVVLGLRKLLGAAENGELKGVCYATVNADDELTFGILSTPDCGVHELVGVSQMLNFRLIQATGV
jgi:hypothetical protein